MNITKEQLRRLAKLDALERGGVDNWEFYDEALTEYSNTIEKEEKIEDFMENIFEIICTYIEEPAGRGCGYGIRIEGQEKAIEFALKEIKELN